MVQDSKPNAAVFVMKFEYSELFSNLRIDLKVTYNDDAYWFGYYSEFIRCC